MEYDGRREVGVVEACTASLSRGIDFGLGAVPRMKSWAYVAGGVTANWVS